MDTKTNSKTIPQRISLLLKNPILKAEGLGYTFSRRKEPSKRGGVKLLIVQRSESLTVNAFLN
jgi:hypothetical protein